MGPYHFYCLVNFVFFCFKEDNKQVQIIVFVVINNMPQDFVD